MADIYVLYLEDSLVSRALSLIRRLCDPQSRSKPHVTVYGPVRTRELPKALQGTKFKELYFEKVGEWETGSRHTIFIKCNLGEQQVFHYKPDYPQSVPHITLYDGPLTKWSSDVSKLCQEIKTGGRIAFSEEISLTRKTIGAGPSQNTPQIKENELFRNLFPQRNIDELSLETTAGERVRMLSEVIKFLNRNLEDDHRQKKLKHYSPRLRPALEQLELPMGNFGKIHHHGSYNSTKRARKILGQFLTPPELALAIARESMHHFDDKISVRFGDPAVGSGVFFGAFLEAAKGFKFDDAIGVDIDPNICDVCEGFWGEHGLTVLKADFFKIDYFSKRNLIICNPPYVRYQCIPLANRKYYQKEIFENLQVALGNTCGLYVYFMFFSFFWLEKDGIASWLISSEICSANYAEPLRQYLVKNCTLLHIHNYDPSDIQFDNVFTSSAFLIYRNSPPPKGHKVRYSYGGALAAPKSDKLIIQSTLESFDRWYLNPIEFGTSKRLETDLIFSELFSVRRGIATGANDYFIISREQAQEFGIPMKFLKPILPRPRDLARGTIIDCDLAQSFSLVIDCTLSEELIQKRYPRFWNYLESGKEKGIDARNLPSRRKPWYSQERRNAAPFYFAYSGRGKGDAYPFRFIWNKSGALATNSYLFVEPVGELARRVESGAVSTEDVYNALCSISLRNITQYSRVYGGGLYKNEPGDLKRVKINEFRRLLK